MLIDIYHDTVCPWCRIGKKHLFKALDKWKEEPVEIRWRPFLLDINVPADGYEFRSFMQHRKGVSPSELNQLLNYTTRAGAIAGVKLDFDNVRLAVNTLLSHRLIELTPDEYKIDVVEALYKAYFEDGLNLGDIDIIVAFGKVAGIDAIELRRKMRDRSALENIIAASAAAKHQGITSIPLFVFDNQVEVDGSYSVDTFLQALNRAAMLKISEIW